MKENNSDTDESLYSIDHNGKRKLEYIPIVKMLRGKYHTIAYGSEVYVYGEGKYVKGNTILKAEISDISYRVGVCGSVKRPTEEIMHYLKTLSPETEYPFNLHDNAVPVNNGVVLVDFENKSFNLVPHDPKYKFNYKFNVDYVDVVDGDARIIHDEAICKYVDEKDVITLYQMFAQSILQALGSAPFKKSYLLQADPDAGKSSFLEIPLRMFGIDTHSHVSLQRLSDDRFALAELEGKILNVHDDLSDVPMKDAGIFKAITGSRRHGIQRKGETGYDADLFAVHLYTCNSPPELNERVQRDTAFLGRWEYIMFTNRFESDPYFYSRVFTPENISVCFYDVLVQILNVHENGLIANSDAGEVREKWNYNADPLYRYLVTNLIDADNKVMYIEKEKFLSSYKRWCVSNDVEQSKIHSDTNPFTRALDKYRIVATRKRDSSGQRIQVYEIPMRWVAETSFAVTPIIQKTDQSSFG